MMNENMLANPNLQDSPEKTQFKNTHGLPESETPQFQFENGEQSANNRKNMLDELKNANQSYSASNSTIIEENEMEDLQSQPS